MNFLGHLYFSGNDKQLMFANLLGDFIKGRNLEKYPELIQKGVRLHREIDSYIDQHKVIKDLNKYLYSELPKITPIAVDLFFDHLLAKNWNDHSSIDLRTFINDFHSTESNLKEYFPEDFKFLLNKMKTDDWLFNYQSMEGLTFACSGLSKRISFDNNLYEAPKVYLSLESTIEKAFDEFIEEAKIHFNSVK